MSISFFIEPMKVLLIHQNMPGQYKHLARVLGADSSNTVVFITKPKPDVNIPGVHKLEFKTRREPSPHTHRYLIGTERSILQGQEVWRMCKKLRDDEGFIPDVICGHPGWGDMLFIKDVYPKTPVLSFFEFYYRAHGADVNFDPNDQSASDDEARIRIKNITNLLSLESADWGIAPTRWQFQQNPQEFQSKISVIHDGVDVDVCVPNPNAKINASGTELTCKDEVITYISRNFEPYRGFPTFMKAVEIIHARRPNCHIIAVGADEVSYGKKPPGGQTYRQLFMKQTKYDKTRLHWAGFLEYKQLLKIYQISSAHIYLTFPFVLSWSMMEAMASECLVIGSDTAPVSEVIKDGHNGLLTDFFSPEQLANRIDEVLDHKDRMAELRKNARKTIVDKYSLSKLLPLHVGLVKDLAKGELPPSTHSQIVDLNVANGIFTPTEAESLKYSRRAA
jgi:glycosyltransferase involved in cell wall biosynthesis